MATQKLVRAELSKAPTGIPGLDDITNGGFPQGRPTLVAGGPGSGKTLLGVSFLVNGAQQYAEPGVLLTFEENADELSQDVRSLGYDLDGAGRAEETASSTTSTSIAARSRKPANTTSKGCSCGSITPSSRSARSA